MPVLSGNHSPDTIAGHHGTVNNTTSSAYLVISLAFLLTLGISISRRNRKVTGEKNSNKEKNASILCQRNDSSARMMQDSSPSALPEKPYLPNPAPLSVAMEHQQATEKSATLSQEKPELEYDFDAIQSSSTHQPFQPRFSQHHEISAKPSSSHPRVPHPHQQPLFQKRLGSLPAVTTSLLQPEPPSPTIALSGAPMKIQTSIPFQSQNPVYDEQEQTQFQGQPHIMGQYIQNDMIFVPSPTEYTSFEALYSKYPPPIYHAPNPTSYTSMDSDFSTNQTSFSTIDGNPDYKDSSLPRRRSYTKTLSNGSEMSGEITVGSHEGGSVAGGQWRRHTRVFGGGVCMACEESESRRLTA